MKTGLLQVLWLTLLISMTARAVDTNPPPRLTVELRDGSRVIGPSADQSFKFRSELLGNLKLPVQDIRTVDCVSSNSAKLTTANGDSLTVSFTDSEFAIQTSFGKVALPFASVRSFSVSVSRASGAHPPGLVALWSGEGDGRDLVNGIEAKFVDIDFADGKVGRAFSLNGSSSWMKIPASPSLDVGKGDGLTLTAWIKPSNASGRLPFLEWSTPAQMGVNLCFEQGGVLLANVVDNAGNSHIFKSRPGAIVNNQFQQVALTYDKTSGVGKLFINGRIIARANWGTFTPQTAEDLMVCHRLGDQPGSWSWNTFYAGLIDEITIYKRALSDSEIEAICKEENNGELPLAPAPRSARTFNGMYRGGFNE